MKRCMEVEDATSASSRKRGPCFDKRVQTVDLNCFEKVFPFNSLYTFLFRQPTKTTMISTNTIRARSLYRSILRELPPRSISSPSPIKLRLRATFSNALSDSGVTRQRLDEGEQYVHYAKAQRMYATLLERYNPGMSMDEEERVRKTMKRVGMDAPKAFEWKPNNG